MSRRNVEFHPEAVVEAREARLWYADRDSAVAGRFVAELSDAIERIGRAPERWPLRPDGTRRQLFARFPYEVVYRVDQERVQVIAVAHLRRRPRYWQNR